ncbi:MAG: hypothetical protein ACJAVK_001318 [Akkermansiaceae bacterium]|jgi:hypothetical protein
MKAPSLVLLAGSVLGFALGQITWDRTPKVGEKNSPTTISARKSQERIGSGRSPASQTERTSSTRTSFDHHSLRTLADWNDQDLNPLTVARILTEIGRLDEHELLDIFNNHALVNSEHEFMDKVKTSAVIRWVELLGPRAFHDLKTNRHLAINGAIDDMEIIAQGFGLWTLKHPNEARRWFEQSMTGLEELRNSDLDLWNILSDKDLLSAFIRSHERVRKGTTRDLASLLSSQRDREDFLERLARAQVDHEDSRVTLKDFLKNEDPFLQQQAIAKLLRLDPPFARDWISQQVASEEGDDIIVQAAQSYCEDDLSKGAQWFLQQQLFTTEAKSERLASLVTRIANWKDVEQAAEWLRQQPDTGERDQAEMFMARRNLASRNYEEGIIWIAGVSDPELREEIISEVLPFEDATAGILPEVPSKVARVDRNSIDEILNNPSRTSADFIGTVDRVYIPGIPAVFSDIDRIKFREAAERQGLLPAGRREIPLNQEVLKNPK